MGAKNSVAAVPKNSNEIRFDTGKGKPAPKGFAELSVGAEVTVTTKGKVSSISAGDEWSGPSFRVVVQSVSIGEPEKAKARPKYRMRG